MSSKIYNLMVSLYVAAAQLQQKMERGDADSSGSTLRTVGIVVLIVLVIGVLGAAVFVAASGAANSIGTTSFSFN